MDLKRKELGILLNTSTSRISDYLKAKSEITLNIPKDLHQKSKALSYPKKVKCSLPFRLECPYPKSLWGKENTVPESNQKQRNRKYAKK